jgi:hypothetical protein
VEVPPEVVTVTSTVPIDSGGEVTVSVVAALNKTVAEIEPKPSEVGLARSVPISVTLWAPEVGRSSRSRRSP